MAEQPRELPAPYPLAIVICDMIWHDPSTGKRTILGCFSSIAAHGFPATHPSMAVYFALTDGHGKVPIKLRLVDVDEKEAALFEAETEVTFEDPRVVFEGSVFLRNLVFPAPGEYRFQIFARDTFIIERRIVVQQIGGENDEQ